MNLIKNAIEAMPDGGTLSVTVSRTSDTLQVGITDTGSGIGEEEAKKIFEPFYTTKTHGLGLGMPYAKKIVEQHGGVIRVSSKPGIGTRFLVVLPLAGAGATP